MTFYEPRVNTRCIKVNDGEEEAAETKKKIVNIASRVGSRYGGGGSSEGDCMEKLLAASVCRK